MPELVGVLSKYKIDKKDVCIVGSAAMSLKGLRENNDIDIVMKSSNRTDAFSKESQSLSENIELVSQNWFFCDDDITDDDIIENEKYHDVCCCGQSGHDGG